MTPPVLRVWGSTGRKVWGRGAGHHRHRLSSGKGREGDGSGEERHRDGECQLTMSTIFGPGRTRWILTMRVRPLIKDLKGIADEYGWDGTDVVLWMTSPTTWFAGEGRRVDHFEDRAGSWPASRTKPGERGERSRAGGNAQDLEPEGG